MEGFDWKRQARAVVDVGRVPPFSLQGRGHILRGLALAVLLLVAVSSTYYQVNADELGVVQRFGRYVRTTEPGPHVKIPFVERVTRVPVQRQLKTEFGFRTTAAGVQSQYEQTADTRAESLMLTGDLNVAVVEWIVQYKVKDPVQVPLQGEEPRRRRAAQRTLHLPRHERSRDAGRRRRPQRQRGAHRRPRRDPDRRQARAAEPVRSIRDRHRGAADRAAGRESARPGEASRSTRSTRPSRRTNALINEAWADYNQTVPNARGEAERVVRAAEGYALERVNNARGDVARFVNIYDEYRKAPEVTRTRLYLETLAEVLPKTGRKLIVDSR